MNMRQQFHAGNIGFDDHVLVISLAAELAGMHAQTLRNYDKLGLVIPKRTGGGGRRYSPRNIRMLQEIQRLSQEEGISLEGIKRIIELTEQNDQLRARNQQLASQIADMANRADAAGIEIGQSSYAPRPQRDAYTRPSLAAGTPRTGNSLVHVPRSRAVVVWKPRT